MYEESTPQIEKDSAVKDNHDSSDTPEDIAIKYHDPHPLCLQNIFDTLTNHPFVTAESIRLRKEFEVKANHIINILKSEYPDMDVFIGLAGSIAIGMAQPGSDIDPVCIVRFSEGTIKSEKYASAKDRLKSLACEINPTHIPIFDISEMNKLYRSGSHEMDIDSTFDESDESYTYWRNGPNQPDAVGLLEQRKRLYPEIFPLTILFAPTTSAQEISGIPDNFRREMVETIAQRHDVSQFWRLVQSAWNLQYVRPDMRELLEDIIGKQYSEKVRAILRSGMNIHRQTRNQKPLTDDEFDIFKYHVDEYRAKLVLPDIAYLLKEYSETNPENLIT